MGINEWCFVSRYLVIAENEEDKWVKIMCGGGLWMGIRRYTKHKTWKWSVFLIFFLVLASWALNRDEHVIFVRSDHDFLLFGLDSEEGHIVGRIKVSDHTSGLFGQEGNVLGVIVA